MKAIDLRIGRRAFFLKATAAMGAGVAATAGAAAPVQDVAPAAADREAIRQLHLSWMRLMEASEFSAAAALFDAQATLSEFGRQQAPALHLAYRPNARQHLDVMALQANGEFSATWNVDVAVGVPLTGNSTAEQMARLQGNLAERRWESGILHSRYRKSHGAWKIAALEYRRG